VDRADSSAKDSELGPVMESGETVSPADSEKRWNPRVCG